MSQTILVFSPHPDDAEFFAGGTIAQFAAQGARAILVIATDGSRGSFDIPSERLVGMRAEEARRGAAALGAEPPILLGHADLELDRLAPGLLREEFIRSIRQYRPDVVIAEDPFAPYDPHPDHRAVARAVSEALAFATLPLMHPEHHAQGLEPHFVAEKYFYSEHLPSTNKIVDITATMEVKLKALGEHTSQMAFLVEDVMRQARVAGLDPRPLLGEALNDPMAAVAWAMQAQAAEAGSRGGVTYGEAFRYVRFHPLVESLLAMQG